MKPTLKPEEMELTREEQELEDALGRAIDDGTLEEVPVDQAELEAALENTLRKTERINIRMSRVTKARIQARADKEGLPYQTLITSIVHKYVTGQLVDRS